MSKIYFDPNEFPEKTKKISLKKSILKIITDFQEGRSSRMASPVGDFYHSYDFTLNLELRTKFGEGYPDRVEMKSNNKKNLYNRIIEKDNFVQISQDESGYGYSKKIIIKTKGGDDVFTHHEDRDQKHTYKSIKVDTGSGDDIIGANSRHWTNDYMDFETDIPPKITYRTGKGNDVIFGVPRGAEALVKDFDTDNDSFSKNGFSRRYKFFETAEGVAIIDRRFQDGMLLLEGVESISQINILNDTLF